MKIKHIIPQLADRFVPAIRNAWWKYLGGDKAYCLCFHDVSDNPNMYAITAEEFFSLIETIKERIVSIDDLKKTSQSSPIVLTFDDGYENLVNIVSPFLESRNVPFTCYIATDYINRKGYLTEAQLIEMSHNEHCTIGSHMCSHSRTRQMTSRQVKEEWEKSKEILQNLIGQEVRHAALPYGSYLACTAKSKLLALKVGYDTIANTIATPFSRSNKEIYRYVYQKNIDRMQQIL